MNSASKRKTASRAAKPNPLRRLSIQTWALAGLMLVSGMTLLFNLDPWGQKVTLRGHQAAVIGAAFSHDDRRVATTSSDGTVRTWDVNSGKELSRTHSALAAAARSPLAQPAKNIRSYNDGPSSLKPLSATSKQAGYWATFSDSGKLLIAGTGEATVTIWERRRASSFSGILTIPEFWVTLLLSIALNWSLSVDLRRRARVPIPVPARSAV